MDIDWNKFFDISFYQTQISESANVKNPLRHYLNEGYKAGLNPTPFFEHQWYAWQNPDYRLYHDNPYIHYLKIGRFEGRDPSPRVDMVRYGEYFGNIKDVSQYYENILQGVHSPAFGVYETWMDLKSAQDAFFKAITIYSHRIRLHRPPKPYLVFFQCGPQSCHREWFHNNNRNWDILVNYYDYSGFDSDFGDYVIFQPGTKFTGVYNIWERYRDLLQQYRYILFLDDDILVDVDSVNRLFSICDKADLDLAQMSLSKLSHCTWKVFFNKSGQELRPVNGVEIMMPVLSCKAMATVGDDFSLSVSGFGLDFLFSKKLRDNKRNNFAVIDDVVAHHTKPIDEANGSYYEYLRSCLINPKAELWYLISTYNLKSNFHEI